MSIHLAQVSSLLPKAPPILSHLLSFHFTLASRVFGFGHDQLNHTEVLSFPDIRGTQMALILSLLMQCFWHTGDKCGAFTHTERMH